MTDITGDIAFIADQATPDDILDFGFIWTTWLAGDTILTSSWTLPAGLSEAQADEQTTTVTTVWIDFSAAEQGVQYQVTNVITTAGGRSKELSFFVPVV